MKQEAAHLHEVEERSLDNKLKNFPNLFVQNMQNMQKKMQACTAPGSTGEVVNSSPAQE